MNTPLVSAQWVRERLSGHSPSVIILDFRWYLSGKVGADEYAKGHIPGARFVAMENVTHHDAEHPGPGRHPIPTRAEFAQEMQRVGVMQDSNVVVYDDVQGSIAARLWWLLRYFGHDKVSVLDGGLQAFVRAGGVLSTETPVGSPGDFVAHEPRANWVVDQNAVKLASEQATSLILDARVGERYRGELEPVDARPGHIPTAKNAPWTENVQPGPEPVFKSPEALRAQYQALGVTELAEVIVYCGSGVTACHDLLAIAVAGLPQPKLYEGSWSDWARNPALTAVKGAG